MAPSTIILLNGVSSAGKTTLARALQDALHDPFLYVAVDHFVDMRPRKPLEGMYTRYLVPAMHRCIAVLTEKGACVIVDHVLLAPSWLHDAAAQWAAFPVHFIGVHCSPAEPERRELAREDRRVGLAKSQLDQVHAHGQYDLIVDTTSTSVEECAARVRHYLLAGSQPTAFRRVLQQVTPETH